MSYERGPRGLNILCIDGGGARGLSSLVVLQEVMNRLEGLKDGNTAIEPADCFDVIAGSGTGGLSACMLGRLRMPLNSAIEEYAKLIQEVFANKKIIQKSGPSAYKGTKLREALRQITIRSGKDGENMEEEGNPDACKTIICAMSRQNMNASLPTMFRSYRVTANRGPKSTVLDALYATMAHPNLFKDIEIGEGALRQSFVSGDLGCSNPTAHVLAEVKRLYPGRHVSCILSIGAGHARTISIPDYSIPQQIFHTQDLVTMKNMATDGERVAEEMAVRFGGTQGIYFRLNVDRGIQDMGAGDWERLNDVIAHAKAYLFKTDTGRKMEELVLTLEKRANALEVGFIDGQVQRYQIRRAPRFRKCPAPTPVYTGRKDEAKQVIGCILEMGHERPVCVIYGLGGSGKTQLALKVVEETRNEWVEVLYIDGTSREAIENALESFVEARHIGHTYHDAIDWLESCGLGRWLIIFDNVDDPSVCAIIHHYIPRGNLGSILITTQLVDLAFLARGSGSVCHISSGMKPEDSLALLIKVTRLLDQRLPEAEMKEAMALVEDFGHLALAIVHAGAYIVHSPGLKISKYRKLFLSQRQRMLEQYRELLVKVDDYSKTVYTTWEMCYNRLRPPSKHLLWLVAFLHHEAITEEIFERASTNVALDPRARMFLFPPTPIVTNAYMHVKECLGQFLDSTGAWDSPQFLNIIGEIVSYSLIDSDRMNGTYNLHVLVQDWARTRVEQGFEMAFECTAALLSLSIGFDDTLESRSFMIGLETHLNSFLSHQKTVSAKDYHRQFAKVYRELKRWKKVGDLENNMYQEMRQSRGEKHLYTLGCMVDLASTYLTLGHLAMAEKLQTNALHTQREVLGPHHPHTQRSITNLASIYLKQGRWSEAEQLQLQTFIDGPQSRLSGAINNPNPSSDGFVLDRWTLAPQHPVLEPGELLLEGDFWNTLRGKTNLALAYYHQDRLAEADVLQTEVLNAYRSKYTEDHPETILSMINLASIYSKQTRWEEAERLQTHIIELQTRLFGERDTRTLSSMAELGATYSQQGRWAEAETLQRRILKLRIEMLGVGHPDTLDSQTELGVACSKQDKWDEAEQLQQLVLRMRTQQLGERHSQTLRNMSELVFIYMSKGEWAAAEGIQNRVLDAHRPISAQEQLEMLLEIERMVTIYSGLCQWTKAEDLCNRALEIEAKIFGGGSSDIHAYVVEIRCRASLERQKSRHHALKSVVVSLAERVRLFTSNMSLRSPRTWILFFILLVLIHYPCFARRQSGSEHLGALSIHKILGAVCFTLVGGVMTWILREQHRHLVKRRQSMNNTSQEPLYAVTKLV